MKGHGERGREEKGREVTSGQEGIIESISVVFLAL